MPFLAKPDILDLRKIPPAERHPLIFRTFRALRPGESFLLINDHAPRPLLDQFQFEHAGEFEWCPWEEGPTDWKVQIVRREPCGLYRRHVTEFLVHDHERLNEHFIAGREAVRLNNWEDALHEIGVFRHGLARHVAMEHHLLFPLYSELTGEREGGPVTVLRREHDNLINLSECLWLALEARDREEFLEIAEDFYSQLSLHSGKEESVIYPEFEQRITPEQSHRLVCEMQAL